MISGQVPNYLVIGARTGFLNSLESVEMPYRRFTENFNLDSNSQVAVDLGAAPMPKNSPSGMTVQDFIERSITLTSEEWDITVWIEYTAVQDDQTGDLRRKVEQAGLNFEKHKNQRAFQFLNAGDGNTYGLCYDEQFFFDTDHVDPGAVYQTSQDNVDANNLSLTNFNTGWGLTQQFRDDQGEFKAYAFDLLICHPTNRQMAHQITANPQAEGTANRDANSFAGEFDYLTTPEFDNNAWAIIASSEATKPLIIADREAPGLLHSWFDPNQRGGGHYNFKFFGRYEFHYGDWRLGYLGQT